VGSCSEASEFSKRILEAESAAVGGAMAFSNASGDCAGFGRR